MSTKNTEISLKLDFAGKCPKPDRFGYLDEYSDLIWVLFFATKYVFKRRS